MWTYIARRLLLMIPTFFLITAISFFIMQLAPGGPLEAKLRSGGEGESSAAMVVTQEAKEALMKLYGFDKPVHERYFKWVGDIVTLDFGESLFEYRPVISMIIEKLEVALLFGITSTIVSYLVCMVLGVFKAIYRDTVFDRITTMITFGTYSVPVVVTAIALIIVFSVKLDLLPVIGLHGDDYEDLDTWSYLVDLAKHFVLPFVCYVIGNFAFLTELQKKSMLEELNKDYIRTARAKGLSEKVIYFKHAFRNALIPIVTSLRNIMVAFLGGSFIVEMIFTIPGLGYLGFNALLNRDYPVIMANLTITAILGMISMLLTDILYTVVDPRIDFD